MARGKGEGVKKSTYIAILIALKEKCETIFFLSKLDIFIGRERENYR